MVSVLPRMIAIARIMGKEGGRGVGADFAIYI